MKKMKPCKVNSNIFPLQATNVLFLKILLVAQIGSFNLRWIFKFPLRSLPWALAEPSGGWKKTLKTSLLQKIESKLEPWESLHGEQVLIIDDMSYSKVYKKTLHQFAMYLLSKTLAAGKKANCTAVFFDNYRNASIKIIERDRRSSGNQLLFKTIVSSAVIKQWPLFLL